MKKFILQIALFIAGYWPKFFEKYWGDDFEGFGCFWILLWLAGVVIAGLAICFEEDKIR